MIRYAALLAMMAQTAQAEVLRIGAGPDYPPYFMVENGQRKGIDSALLDEICARASYNCVWTYMPLASLLQAVVEGEIDVAAGGIGYSLERDRVVDFSCVYVIDDNPEGTFFALTHLDLQAAEIAVTGQSLYHNALQKAGYTIRAFDGEEDAINAVLSGKVDAYFGSAHIVQNILDLDGRLINVGTHPTMTSGPAFVVAEERAELLGMLNQNLADISAEGRLAELQQEWLNINQGDVIAKCFDNHLQS